MNAQCGNWVWQGPTGPQTLAKVFTVSGTYLPSPGLVTAVVETYGAGGGGGAVTSTGVTYVQGGGGGGSGGYSRKVLQAALVAGGVNVTIGAGGAGGAAGGQTTFGALCVANGGAAGSLNDGVNNHGYGGGGAVPGTGDVVFPGATGLNGVTFVESAFPTGIVVSGGVGGQLNGGAQLNSAATGFESAGNPGGGNTGAGGGGGVVNQVSTGSAAGGAGGSGLCVVTEYCWADGGQGSGSGCVNVPACPPGQQWGRGGWNE